MSFPAKVKQKYTICDMIGEGGYGIVYKVKQIDATKEKFYAMKVIKEESKQNIENEIKLLKELEYPYLLHLKDHIEADGRIFLFTKYCATDLWKLFNSKGNTLTIDEIWMYFIELCLAVAFLHSNNFVHQDIKLENILVDKNNKIKLADFGLAQHENATTSIGTKFYRSPGMQKGNVASKKSDIWAIGISLYILCEGKYPFKDTTDKSYEHISNPSIPFDLMYFAYWCLEKDSDKRPNIEDILGHSKIKEKIDLLNIDTKSSVLYQSSQINEDKYANFEINWSMKAPRRRQHKVPIFSTLETHSLMVQIPKRNYKKDTKSCEQGNEIFRLAAIRNGLESIPINNSFMSFSSDFNNQLIDGFKRRKEEELNLEIRNYLKMITATSIKSSANSTLKSFKTSTIEELEEHKT